MLPETLSGLLLTAVFLVPGIVYQSVLARLVGEVPANRDVTTKLSRALAASLILDVLYLIVLGPLTVRILGADDRGVAWLEDHARSSAAVALALLFLVPAVVATAMSRLPDGAGRVVVRPGGSIPPRPPGTGRSTTP